MTKIRLRNTMTRKVEAFEPIDPNAVRMYVCGPTVYDRAHLGNARPVVVFDVLYRLLRHVYGEGAVTYVRNFTDVDDKINAKSAETGRPIRDITDETIAWYHQDMDALGAMRPNHEPRATEWIGAMIAMIERLIAQGHAYAAEGHALFRVRSFKAYGALSGRSVDDMIAGARVEVAPFKEDPMDFVLWKPSSGDQPGWESPWGYGRPGWHIECSAMADGLLWEAMKAQLSPAAQALPHVFDIHGGGIDLQFPHHENEVAQSCCAHGHADPVNGFARFWLHNEMLLVEGKKMSKSLGNFFTVRELLDQGIAGEVVRLVFLMTHYSKPMDWTSKKAEEAKARLVAWSNMRRQLWGQEALPQDAALVDREVLEALGDDLNSSLALTKLYELQARVQRLGAEAVGHDETHSFFATLNFLGFSGEYPLDASLDASLSNAQIDVTLKTLADKLTALRDAAKQSKDFSAVDAMKTALLAAGVEVRMTKEGVELSPAEGFSQDKVQLLL